jgi:hypothetical protein
VIFTVVFLIILAVFVLLFTVRARVTVDLSDELSLFVGVGGVKIKILPKKQKKYKISDYTPKKIAKRDKKAAEKAKKKAERDALKKQKKAADKKRKKDEQAKLTKEQKKAQKAQKKAGRPPLPDTLSLFLRIIKLFFSGFFSHFHFHVAKIRISVGGADAAQIALTYCALTNVLHPIFAFLGKHSNLHGMKNADILISTDYLSEEIKAEVKLGFSMSLGGLLGVLLKSAFSFIFGWLKIKPSAPKSSSGTASKEDTTVKELASASQSGK